MFLSPSSTKHSESCRTGPAPPPPPPPQCYRQLLVTDVLLHLDRWIQEGAGSCWRAGYRGDTMSSLRRSGVLLTCLSSTPPQHVKPRLLPSHSQSRRVAQSDGAGLQLRAAHVVSSST